MPKVSNHTFKIDGEFIKFDIHYTKTDQFHIKDFPKKVLVCSSGVYATGKSTEDALISGLQAAVNTYHELTSKSKRVILIKFNCSHECYMNKTGEGSYQGYQQWFPKELRNKISDGRFNGSGFSISHQNMLQVTHGGIEYWDVDKNWSPRYKSRINDDTGILMDWTQDREDFFIEMGKSCEEMVKNLLLFLADKERMQLMIDNKLKLLN
jgi:hypothetical protein